MFFHVYKYALPPEGRTAVTVELPPGSEVLTVAAQNNAPVLWARVPVALPPVPLVPYRFYLALTGQVLPADCTRECYIGTVQLDAQTAAPFVLHVFLLNGLS